MTIGEKIKKYRNERGLTQKELASMSKLSEPAIRNYELGNRTPSELHIKNIAKALGINPFAISDPNLDSYLGVMHSLFEIEDEYGAYLVQEPGATYIAFPIGSDLSSQLLDWGKIYKAYKDGTLTQEEYAEWKSTYPESVSLNKQKK